jgi:hypothetical protein
VPRAAKVIWHRVPEAVARRGPRLAGPRNRRNRGFRFAHRFRPDTATVGRRRGDLPRLSGRPLSMDPCVGFPVEPTPSRDERLAPGDALARSEAGARGLVQGPGPLRAFSSFGSEVAVACGRLEVVGVFVQSCRMTLEALVRDLNRYPSERVWECLDGIHLHPLRGRESSIRAFTGPTRTAGITIRQVGDLVRLRIGVIQQGAGFFDELEMPEAAAHGLGRALLARLAEWGVQPANEAPTSAPALHMALSPQPDTAGASTRVHTRPLRKDPSSQIRCAACHEPLEGEHETWITGPNMAFYDGELWCAHPGCPGKGGPGEPTITRGREDEEAPPESAAFLAVELDDDEEP